MAMSRSRGSSSFTTRPPISIVPPEIGSSPAIIRSSVDFPQPEGPTRTTNSPSSTERLAPFRISTGPKFLRSSRIVTEAMAPSFHRAERQPAHDEALAEEHQKDGWDGRDHGSRGHLAVLHLVLLGETRDRDRYGRRLTRGETQGHGELVPAEDEGEDAGRYEAR